MKFSLELPGVLQTLLPTTGGDARVLLSLALEKPSISIKGEGTPQGGKLELICNCPDGERQARREAERLRHLVRLELTFRKTEPTTPFSCRVCRPAVVLLALSLARGSPRPMEEAEIMLSFRESTILRNIMMGGTMAFLVPEQEPEPPSSPWTVSYLLPPPGLRIVVAQLPGMEPPRQAQGEGVVILLNALFRMLWDNELYHLPYTLKKLAKKMGWGEEGIPFLPVEGEEDWYWTPLPSPDECSRELIAFREKLADYLDREARERLVTRLSPGGVLEVW